MREVTVRKSELLAIICQNRDTHIADYKEAVANYKAVAIKKIQEGMHALRQQVEALGAGEMISLVAVCFDLDVPENHEKDYDQAIRMLGMEVSEEVLIQSGEFAKFVMDDWAWKADFRNTTEFYKAANRR